MQQITASVGKVYDDFSMMMEKDNRLTEVSKIFFIAFIRCINFLIFYQFGLYGLSLSALIYAYARKRPLTKFVKPKDIPLHFIEEKILQSGVVRKIEPTEKGPLLLVNHKPPISLSFSERALPIKVSKNCLKKKIIFIVVISHLV